jgi:hypothetical protein
LPKFGSKKAKGPKQDRQNLGARKPKDLNSIDRIWEQENLGPLHFLLIDLGYPV